jgi:hypothetical protein
MIEAIRHASLTVAAPSIVEWGPYASRGPYSLWAIQVRYLLVPAPL